MFIYIPHMQGIFSLQMFISSWLWIAHISRQDVQLQITFSISIYFKCNLFLWWQNWIFCSHYSSLQCRKLFQKFEYADL